MIFLLCEWNKIELLELEFVDYIFFIQFLNLTEWIISAWCVDRWRHKMGQGTRPSMWTCSFQIFFVYIPSSVSFGFFAAKKQQFRQNVRDFISNFNFNWDFMENYPFGSLTVSFKVQPNKISNHIYAFQPMEMFLSTFILYSVQFIAFYHIIFPLKYVLP